MKNKTKIICIILIIFILFYIASNVIHFHYVKKVEQEHKLERLYYEQNSAFGLSPDRSKRYVYHSSDELQLNRLVVNMYAYNSAQSNFQLTVDEVVDYLSSEYDSDGNLKIYSQPENVKDYIAWFYHGGDDIALNYGDHFNQYLIEQGYENIFGHMSYEEVLKALDKYINDPNYDPTKQDWD